MNDAHAGCRATVQAAADQAVREGLTEPTLAGQLAPIAIVLAVICAAAAGPHLPAPAALALLVLAGYGHVLMAFIGHDAGHGAHCQSRWLSSLVGLWMFAHSFTNYFGFRTMHRGHHRYTGFDEDPSGDSPKHAKRVGLVTYSLLVLLPLGFPLLVIVPSWLGGFGFQPHVYPAPERWKIRGAFFFVAGYQLALARGLGWLAGPWAYPFFLGSFVLGLWLTTMVLSLSHAGVEMYTDCKLCNTRSVWSSPLLGLLTANGGFHVEHHVVPQAPWYRMRRVHEILREHGGPRHLAAGFTGLHSRMFALYAKRAAAWLRSLAPLPSSEA